MEYTALLTHQPGSSWRAVVPALPDCVAEAPTRAEVLAKIQTRIEETISNTEMLQIEVPALSKDTNGTRDCRCPGRNRCIGAANRPSQFGA